MSKFTGKIANEWRSEPGVNIAVKGANGKIIVAPRGPWMEFEKDQKGKTLTLTLTPSSGTTEKPRMVKAEVKNGTEKITIQPTHWEVAITASSDSKPAEADITIFIEQQEEPKHPFS